MNKHSIMALAALCLMSAPVLTSCSNDPEFADPAQEAHLMDKIQLNVGDNLTMAVGTDKKIEATVPNIDEVLVKDIIWASSDPTVATIDQEGNLNALKTGTSTITLTQDGNFSANTQFVVNVKEKATSLTLSDIELYEKTSQSMAYTITPEDGYNIFDWSSSDESVATVDANGLVTGVTPGTATITAKTTDGSNITATAKVTVKKVIPVESITLVNPDYVLRPGDFTTIECHLLPINADVQLLQWMSSNDKVATVDGYGKVTAVANGTATITAKDPTSGKAQSVDITVGGVASWTISNYKDWNDLVKQCGWTLGQNAKGEIKNGGLHVTTTDQGGKWRGDLGIANTKYPLTLDPKTYQYLAIAMDAPAVKGKRAIKLNIKGPNMNKDYGNEPTGFVDGKSQVAYWDLFTGGRNPEGKLEVFELKMADIKAEPHDYTIYWIKTFKTLDELKAYVSKHYSK